MRRAGLAAVLSLLVAVCGPKADPQFYLVLNNSRTADIEGRIESERARSEMNVAIANALTEAGWAGQARLTVADDVRRMEWEARIGDVMRAVAPLTYGRLAIAAGSVEVTGEAPNETIGAMQPALEKIFGPRYLVRVDVHGPAVVSFGETPPAPTSGTIAYKWTVTVYGDSDVAPPVWLPEEEAGTFDVDGVRCHIGATQRSERHEGDRTYKQVHRDLSCEHATIESLALHGPFIPHGVGCDFRDDLPFADRARMECSDQFTVRREEGDWHRNLLLEARAVVR